MTLIDAENHQRKIRLREDRIAHNMGEIKRLSDQNYILGCELDELKEML